MENLIRVRGLEFRGLEIRDKGLGVWVSERHLIPSNYQIMKISHNSLWVKTVERPIFNLSFSFAKKTLKSHFFIFLNKITTKSHLFAYIFPRPLFPRPCPVSF